MRQKTSVECVEEEIISMAGYESKKSYRVSGNLAEVVQQEVYKEAGKKSLQQEKSRRSKRVLPRNAVDVIPLAYTFVVALACVCILFGTITYVHAKTSVTKYTKELVAVQSELESIKAENKVMQTELSTRTDLNTIKSRAKELGMVKAGKGQIIYYEQSDSEYVRQKEDIPND